MRIREVAAKAGISVETVRFYERANVLPAASRNAAGHRVFGPADQRMLVIIGWAQGLGLSLAEIARFVIKTRDMPIKERKTWLANEVQNRKRLVRAELERLKDLEQDLEILEHTPFDQGVWIPAAFVDHLIVRLGIEDDIPALDGGKVDVARTPNSGARAPSKPISGIASTKAARLAKAPKRRPAAAV